MNFEEKYLTEVIKNFAVSGFVIYVGRYGNGHINDTFLVKCDNGVKYILQRINTNVFKEPKKLMDNIGNVTEFLKKCGEDSRHVLTLVKTDDGQNFYCDNEENYWRMYDFVTDSLCLELPESAEDFYWCAYAFGKFQRDLSDFSAETLFEVIPDFHNTEKRYRDFLNAVDKDKVGRAKEVQKEIDFVKARKDFYSVLWDGHKSGLLPLRVTHNDTKSNNVLLDAETRRALCVIDLDTIMPGFSVTDFGDSIRFGANTASEDEKDLSKVNLDLELFKAYTEGYLKGCGNKLKNSEIMLMPEGAKMMTVECGMRFLADYLEGDVYFKTAYKEHNLVRARTQFKLAEEMEKHFSEMKEIVKKYTY